MMAGAGHIAFVVLTLKACIVLFVPAATASNSACYGETLDVRLVSDRGPDSLGTQMMLPETDFWIVSIGNNQNLIDVPCGPEPVVAFKVTSVVTHALLPNHVRSLLEQEGVRLTIAQFYTISESGMESYRWSQDYWWENVFSDAPETAEGHLRKPSVDGDAIGGSWLLSTSHPDEAGDRINLGCALDCKTRYRLTDRLVIRYHLAVRNKQTQPDWVALDTALRRVFQEWVRSD